VAQGSGRILVMSSVASIRLRRSAYLYDGAKADSTDSVTEWRNR